MATFPGDKTNIPKRLTECLEFQPLNHLVPKSGLCRLLRSSLKVAPVYEKDAFGKQPPSHDNEEKRRFLTLGEDNAVSFHFRELDLATGADANPEYDLFEGLSEHAMRLLNTNCFESLKRERSEEGTQFEGKLESSGNNYGEVDFRTAPKRLKTVSDGFSLNQSALSSQHLRDLERLMESIGKDEESANLENPLFWTKLGSEYVLSELCAEKILMILKNVSSIPEICKTLSVNVLRRILSVCAGSINLILKNDDTGYLNSIAFTCATSILTIFSLDLDEKRLYLESYLISAISFLARINERLQDTDVDHQASNDDCVQLRSLLSLLSCYIQKKPMQEEELITKIVYLLCDLLTFAPPGAGGTSTSTSWLESLKSECSMGLISLFESLPAQRLFIIDELLFRLDTLPTHRVQKKLRRVHNSQYSFLATHLFLTLVSMLQTVNSSKFQPQADQLNEEEVEKFLSRFKEQQEQLAAFVEHVNNSILAKCFPGSAPKKFILDNYVQDLSAMVVHPEWSVSELVLASLFKKLLLTFSPAHPASAAKEAVVIQIIGHIGSVIQEISLKSREFEAYNVVDIFQNRELLSSVMQVFQKCQSYMNQNSKNDMAMHHIWDKQMACLLTLAKFDSSDTQWAELIHDEIVKLLENNSALRLRSISKSKEKSSDYEKDYFGTLYVSELINLFAPYVKLVLSLLDRHRVKLRSGAVKCLTPLIARDPNLLSASSVKGVIEQRLRDSSPSVKDAILDLLSISQYTEFYHLININYNDDSVVVRKHILRLNMGIYDAALDSHVKAFVASRILKRTEDEEDSIVEKAQSALLERWFLVINEKQQSLNDPKIREVANVISLVLGQDRDCSRLFEKYLNDFVLEPELHEADISEHIKASTQLIASKVVDDAISTQYDGAEVKDHANSPIVNTLQLLSILSSCDQSFITKDHITTLFPYLLSPEQSELQYYILKVFRNSFSRLSYFKASFLTDLETVILGRLPKMDLRELEEAMPLCWSIVKHRGDDSRVSKACSSCLGQLAPYINKATKDPSSVVADGKVQRLLYLAAGFARYCNFENTKEKFPQVKTREPILEYVTKCLLVFTTIEIPQNLRKVAIRNLLKVAGVFPKLFNSRHVLKVIDREFSSGSLEIKLIMINCLSDFFAHQEFKSSHMIRPLFRRARSTQRDRSAQEDKTSDTICSALCSRYLKKVLNMARLEDASNTCIALKFVQLALEFGYTNPAYCITTIIALTSSSSDQTHNLALQTLDDILAKNGTMLISKLSSGIREGIEHTRWLQSNGCAINLNYLRKLQETVFEAGTMHSKFLNALNKAFTACAEDTSALHLKEEIIIFCSNISNITYRNMLEPCMLARLLDLKAESLEETIDDSLDIVDEEDEFSRLRDIVAARMCIMELRVFLCRKYGITEECLAAVGTSEEEDLKNKAAEPRIVKASFNFPSPGMDLLKVCNEYLSSAQGHN